MFTKQTQPRQTLGLLPGELAVSPNAVREEDSLKMRSIFRRLAEPLQCCGLLRDFGGELVLQIGDGEPFLVPIPFDLLDWPKTRAERFEAALTRELAALFSHQP